MLKLHIEDETSKLDTVILGIAEDPAGPSGIEPKSEFHLQHDSWPTQESIAKEIASLETALIAAGVKVLRPVNIPNVSQVFARDLGFVIGDTFFISQMSEEREPEQEAIEWITELVGSEKVVDLRELPGVDIEGGDVVLRNNVIFVGLSERTNHRGFLFLQERFPDREVVQLELITDPDDHTVHTLHLDCSFQPVGTDHAIVYEGGIRNIEALYGHLSIRPENIFKTSKWQFVRMFPNILSLSPEKVIIEREFIELKYWLKDHGFEVVEARFRQISKMSGLLRCATLPLKRSDDK
jgi:N-dimethylarginine dimethylaminohydrolase